MIALAGGDAIAELGSTQVGTLGGWFRLRGSREPVALTAAHVLRAPELRGVTPPHSSGVADARSWDARLCRPPSRLPVARALACGVHARHGEAPSADVCVLAPLDGAEPSPALGDLGWRPSIAQAQLGGRVLKLTCAGARWGRVIDIAWESGRYRSPGDLLIESLDSAPFAVDGDSGALILDVERRAAVGLHIGDVRDRVGPPRFCAHPMTWVAELFDLVAWDEP